MRAFGAVVSGFVLGTIVALVTALAISAPGHGPAPSHKTFEDARADAQVECLRRTGFGEWHDDSSGVTVWEHCKAHGHARALAWLQREASGFVLAP